MLESLYTHRDDSTQAHSPSIQVAPETLRAGFARSKVAQRQSESRQAAVPGRNVASWNDTHTLEDLLSCTATCAS